jgi:peptide/nickel transport system substrate-binding protein
MKGDGSLYPQDIKDLWNKIEVTKLNDKNLKFSLPEPFVPFMDYLTFGVLPKHLLESVPADQMANAEFNISPVGSGPYKFDHLLVEDGKITGVVLAVNQNYYGTPPYIEQVVFRYYPTSAAAMDAYRQGEVLSVSQITPDVLNAALEEQNLSIYTSRLPTMGMVMLNTKNTETTFLDNPKVRRALMLAINRPYLINKYLQGQAIVANGPLLPNTWAYHEGLEQIPYDPEQAINILKTEGYVLPADGSEVRAKEGTQLALTLMHPNDPTHAAIAQTIKDEWARITYLTHLPGSPRGPGSLAHPRPGPISLLAPGGSHRRAELLAVG